VSCLADGRSGDVSFLGDATSALEAAGAVSATVFFFGKNEMFFSFSSAFESESADSKRLPFIMILCGVGGDLGGCGDLVGERGGDENWLWLPELRLLLLPPPPPPLPALKVPALKVLASEGFPRREVERLSRGFLVEAGTVFSAARLRVTTERTEHLIYDGM
jgi:hypothetical protein